MPNIVRVKKTKDYFIASNKPFNDNKLSFGARGILAYLLSKPDDWEIRNQDLYNQSPAGRAAVDRMLKELMENGYMHRYRENDSDGLLYWVTVVYEDRLKNPEWDDENQCVKPQPPNVENQAFGESDSPNVEKPTVGLSDCGESDAILSTDLDKVLNLTPNGVNGKPLSAKKRKKPKPFVKDKKPGPRKQLMGTFLSKVNMSLPRNKQTLGFWWSQITEIEHIVEGDVALGQSLIAETVKEMQNESLTISSPKSIVNVLRAKCAARASPNGNGHHIELSTEEQAALEAMRK